MHIMSSWKKELARDFLAFGSYPFYLIVIIRMLLELKFEIIVPRLVIAFIAMLALSLFIKYDYHLSQAFVLAVFTSLAYTDRLFTGFAVIIYLGVIYSASYLKIKRKSIISGIVAGAISSGIAYWLADYLFYSIL